MFVPKKKNRKRKARKNTNETATDIWILNVVAFFKNRILVTGFLVKSDSFEWSYPPAFCSNGYVPKFKKWAGITCHQQIHIVQTNWYSWCVTLLCSGDELYRLHYFEEQFCTALLLPPANELREGNVFSRVCLSTGMRYPCDRYPWCIVPHCTIPLAFGP